MLMTGRDEFTYLRGQLLDQRHPDPNTIESDRLPAVHDNTIVTHMVESSSVESRKSGVVAGGRASGIGAESLLQFSR